MKNFCFIEFSFILCGIISFSLCASKIEKRGVDDNADNPDNTEEMNESMTIAERENNTVTCSRRQDSQVHEIKTAAHKQFPFMVALMSSQNKFLCSGSIVSTGLILTTARCASQAIDHVLLNTTSDQKNNSIAVLHVIKTEKFPTYRGGAGEDKDAGLIYTEKHNNSIANKIKVSNYTSFENIVDIEAIGFGLNAERDHAKELQYVGLEKRSINPSDTSFDGYFDCVNTKIPTCFRDYGGPVIFNFELVGLVKTGQDECTNEVTISYALNKKMVEVVPTFLFKAWLDEKIKKNEEQEPAALATYPSKPSVRKTVHVMTASSGAPLLFVKSLLVFICLLFNP